MKKLLIGLTFVLFTQYTISQQNYVPSKENIEAIIYCLNAAKIILSNGLALLGIKPIEKM